MTRFIATDRFGAYRFDLSDVISAVRTRNVDGTDTLQLTWRGAALEKDDRVLVRFATGEWREYMVASTSRTRGAGLGAMTAACRNSVAELSRKYHVELEGRGYTAGQALAKCLAGTRWSVGTVDVPAAKTADVSFYHQCADKSLEDICAAYGCEVDATVEVGASRVTARKVHLLTAVGASSPKRFEYRKDLVSIKRTVNADDVVTRVYAWGKGLQATDADGNATGGYTRKIGIASINGGKAYVEDADATKRFGVPDASGVPQPAEGSYENGDIEDPAELLALAKADLAARKQPQVSYECDVASLGQAGVSVEGVACGDSVHIVDGAFDPPLRLEGRVLQVEEDLAGGRDSAKVTLGNVCEPITRRSARVESTVQRLTQSAGAWDGAAGLSEGYLNGVIAGVNAVLNAAGGYTYIEPGLGIMVYDRPRDQNPTMCIKIGGGYFQIADGKNADGTWSFRTLGTGHGLVADEIVSGTLDAALIKAGVLQDAAGLNYINMVTGDCRLAGTATAGGKQIATSADIDEVSGKIGDSIDAALADGVVTEAERAAVAKVQQALAKEKANLGNEYETLKASAAMGAIGWSAKQPNMPLGAAFNAAYTAAFGEGNAYDKLADSISGVMSAEGSEALAAAVAAYKSAYSGYSDSLSTYLELARTANDLNAQAKVNKLDTSLDQSDVFNRLTNNGKTQGIYMSNGLLYVNASYVGTGVIKNRYNTTNYWNLDTGTLQAGNITATGTFKCGYSNYYTQLNSVGQFAGYRATSDSSAQRVGYIDYSSSMRDVDSGNVYYGLQFQAQGGIRISAPKMSAANTSDVGTTATYGSTGTVWLAGFTYDPGSGWDVYSLRSLNMGFINGLCTRSM